MLELASDGGMVPDLSNDQRRTREELLAPARPPDAGWRKTCGPGARDMILVSVNSVSTSAADQSVCGGEALRAVQKMARLSFVSAPAPNRRQMETVPGWQRESLDGVGMVLYPLALSSHGRVPLSNLSRSRRLLARLTR